MAEDSVNYNTGFIEVFNNNVYEDVVKDPHKINCCPNLSVSSTSLTAALKEQTLQNTTLNKTENSHNLSLLGKSIFDNEKIKKKRKIELLQNQWDTLRQRDMEFIAEKLKTDEEKTNQYVDMVIKQLNDGTSELSIGKKLIETVEKTEKRAQTRTLKEWHDKVYNPIQNKIKNPHDTQLKSKLNRQDPLKQDLYKIDSEKRILSNAYHTKHEPILKPKVRTEIIDPSEYSRLSHLPGCRDQKILYTLQTSQKIPTYVSGGDVISNHYNFSKDQKTVKKEYFPGGRKILPTPGGVGNFSFDKL